MSVGNMSKKQVNVLLVEIVNRNLGDCVIAETAEYLVKRAIKSNDKINSQNNFFFHAVYLPNIEFNYYAKEINKTTIMNRNQEELKNLLYNKKIE